MRSVVRVVVAISFVLLLVLVLVLRWAAAGVIAVWRGTNSALVLRDLPRLLTSPGAPTVPGKPLGAQEAGDTGGGRVARDVGQLAVGELERRAVGALGGAAVFVNCGSVGKPKDGDPAGLCRPPAVAARIERFDYDAEAVADEVAAAGLASEYAHDLLAAA